MEFKYIDEIIEDISINLNVLKKSTEVYECLLYQHKGKFFADQNKLGNETDQSELFDNLIAKGKEKNVDLLMTPEYSCPISTIEKIILDQNNWPAKNKLWVLGSESMKVEQLNSILKLANENLHIEYDESIDPNSSANLDPVFYLFKAQRNEQELLVVLIQFKTQHMGVWTSSLERDNFLQGTYIYVLRNNENSVNLFTLICSEALEFQNAMCSKNIDYLSFDEKPTIILHPQMNPKPKDSGFVRFRNFLMQFERKELFSLNWHCETTINNTPFPDQLSRSGILFKGNEVQLTENTFISNFKIDFHIFHNKKSRYYFFFGNQDQLVHFRNQPLLPLPGANLALYRKNGPTIKNKFVYNIEAGLFETDIKSNNNYIDELNELGCTNSFITSADKSILDKERLCVLCSLFFDKPTSDYSKIEKLVSLHIDENHEVIQRISLIDVKCSRNRDVITKFITSLNELERVINTNELLPKSLINLKENVNHIGFDITTGSSNYLCNVIGSDGKSQKATVTFQSLNITEIEAKKQFKKLLDLFEDENPLKRRVVLYYKQGLVDKYETYNKPPSIIDTIEDSPVLIDKL